MATSSVSTLASAVAVARRLAKECPPPRRRSGSAIIVRAVSAASRWPVTNSTRSHQCAPMSANARERPAGRRVDPPVVVVGAEQPVLEVGAVDQPHVADPARRAPARGPRGRSGSSGRRTAPSRPGPATRARPHELRGAGGVEGHRLLADDVLARRRGRRARGSGGGRSGRRRERHRPRPRRSAPRRPAKLRSAPSSRLASALRSGEEATIPAGSRRPPGPTGRGRGR